MVLVVLIALAPIKKRTRSPMSIPGEMEQLKDVDLHALTLSRGERTKTGMSFHRVFYRGEPLSLILGAVGDFPATMPFEPSVYNGDGSEARKTARLDVADDLVEAMARFEERILELLGADAWNYAHKKASDQYPGCIRAKIWTTGERACVLSLRAHRGSGVALASVCEDCMKQ
jgi:hypothetical protein